MSVIDIKISQYKRYYGADGWGSPVDSPGSEWYAAKVMANGEGGNDFRMAQLKFAANSLFDIATVNSVLLYFNLSQNQVYQSDRNVHVRVSDTDQVSSTISGTNYNNLSSGTGWKYVDITSLFAALANQSAAWYVILSCDNDNAGEPYSAEMTGLDTTGNETYIHVDFTAIPSACTAPTSVSVDDATPIPDATVNLSGSGAAAGDWNTITGYGIFRATSSDGEYFFYKEIVTTETFFSTTVVAPSEPGAAYYYKAKTRGSEGSAYDSALSSQYASVTATTADCVAPSTISLSAVVSSKPVSLTWGGAYPGIGNPITAYEIEYSDSADNVSWGAWTALKTLYTTATSGTYLAAINATLGQYRRYQIKTIGTYAGQDSAWSAASASVRTSSSSTTELQTPKLIIYEYPHVVTSVEKGAFPLDFVQQYNTLIWHRVYQGVGDFALSVPFSTEANALLVERNLIGIAGRNELMLITKVSITEDIEGKESINVTGKSLAAILSKRTVTSSEQLTDHPVGHIKAILRNQPIFLEHYDGGVSDYVPDINGDLDADGDRRFPDFHWKEPSFSYTGDATLIFQAQKLAGMLDTIISLCKINGYGLRVVSELYNATADTLTMWFEIYKGNDFSTGQDVNPHVVFDEVLGNIKHQQYSASIENEKTAGYATNLAIDTLSAYDLRLVDITSENVYSAGDQTYINAGSNPANVGGGSGMSRSEMGMAISEIEEPTAGTTDEKIQDLYDSCKQIGRNDIENSGVERIFDVEIDPFPTNLPQYLTDYDLGDIVTARNTRWGVTMDARIAEVTETYEAGKKLQVSFVLGDPAITMLARIRQITRRRG